MEKEWNWIEKTNKKEAIKEELEPLIMDMINDDVEYLLTSPQVCAILNECNNMVVVSNNEIIQHEEDPKYEHVFNFINANKIIKVYSITNKSNNETIIFKVNKGINRTLKIIIK